MQETLTVENITKSDILSILEPYRKKKPYLLPQGWSINMEEPIRRNVAPFEMQKDIIPL